ncbi:MAG: hypothetical protein OXE05_12680 [Chloroflexi bacterium]|nr:hypothetical protein [Chloroflexota bacterium]
MPRILSVVLALILLLLSAVPLPADEIDPRLQDALNMIEETWPGGVYGEYSAVTTKDPKFTFGHIEHLAQYTISTNTITVDESMRHQPLEVIAYLLVHELFHAGHPWTKYGEKPKGGEGLAIDYCFMNEHFAENRAAWWWSKRYGEAGHPDTDNARVRHANYAAWLFRQDYRDIENGKEANRFKDFMRELLKDYCKLGQTAAPVPTPTPAPQQSATNRIAALERRIAALERRIQQMENTGNSDQHTHRCGTTLLGRGQHTHYPASWLLDDPGHEHQIQCQ